MGTVNGSIGSSGANTYFNTAQSIGVTLSANDKPNGTVTFNNIQGGGAYWQNRNLSRDLSVDLYLCDSEGNNKYKLFTLTLAKNYGSDTWTKTATIDAPNLKGKALFLIMDGTGDAEDYIVLHNQTSITIATETVAYNVTTAVSPSGSGTLTTNKAAAAPGETVTLTPTAATGYEFSSYTSSPSVTITNNKFTMPSQAVTVTAKFTKKSYTVSKAVSPSGAGTVTLSKTSATMGTEITLTATPAAGYQFSGWSSSPSVTISNNKFTMPASNVTITATFTKVTYTITKAASPTGSGTVSSSANSAVMGTEITMTATAATGYQFSSWSSSPSVTFSGNKFTMPAGNITVTGNFTKKSYTITKSSVTGGTISVSASSAVMGTTITLSASAATGYEFLSWSVSPAVTISNNKFTMPASNVTVSATFQKKTYTITKAASPSAGGTVYVKKNNANVTSAQYGDTLAITQTANSGYYFNGWTTSPSITIGNNGAATMPAGNLSVTAKYLKISTASLSKTSMAGGTTVTMTINADKTTYTHKYKLSFGTNMETSLTSVAAGVTSVSISVPDTWSNQIPNAASKGSGTLLLETYNGSTKIGEFTLTGLTYTVPSSAKPTIATIAKEIVRTIGGTTYADVGNYYVQNHSGIRLQTGAHSELSATITQMTLTISGYTGSGYSTTVNTGSIDFTTGLLTNAGSATVTVTATDSRGRTATKTTTFTVTAYNKPSGTLQVQRADANGDPDDFGTYGIFELTKSFTAVGTNSLTVTLKRGTTETVTGTSGFILPGSHKTFNILSEYSVVMTLTDAFESVTVTDKIPSASFIIHVSSNGKKLAFMKVGNKAIPTGKSGTVEFSGDHQIYIGDDTLEDFIAAVLQDSVVHKSGTETVGGQKKFTSTPVIMSGNSTSNLQYQSAKNSLPNGLIRLYNAGTGNTEEYGQPQFEFIQYSPNSDGTARKDYYERYSLPEVNVNRSSNVRYYIHTEKEFKIVNGEIAANSSVDLTLGSTTCAMISVFGNSNARNAWFIIKANSGPTTCYFQKIGGGSDITGSDQSGNFRITNSSGGAVYVYCIVYTGSLAFPSA